MESIIFCILNLKEWDRLNDEAGQLEDPEEREARTQLLDRIDEAIMDYDVHVRTYTWKQTVRNIIRTRGICLVPVERDLVLRQWDEQFDSAVSAETKAATAYYSDQFRWHLFSFELLPALQGEQARAAFDAAEKGPLYLFHDYANETFLVRDADRLNAEDIDALRENSPLDYADLYLFDPEGKWTYVRTHEESCGPYFFQAED